MQESSAAVEGESRSRSRSEALGVKGRSGSGEREERQNKFPVAAVPLILLRRDAKGESRRIQRTARLLHWVRSGQEDASLSLSVSPSLEARIWIVGGTAAGDVCPDLRPTRSDADDEEEDESYE